MFKKNLGGYTVQKIIGLSEPDWRLEFEQPGICDSGGLHAGLGVPRRDLEQHFLAGLIVIFDEQFSKLKVSESVDGCMSLPVILTHEVGKQHVDLCQNPFFGFDGNT